MSCLASMWLPWSRGLREEKDGVAHGGGAAVEQAVGVGDGVEGADVGFVAGLDFGEAGGEDIGVGGEVTDEGGVVAVGDDGDLVRGAAGKGVEHGGKATDLRELFGGGAAALGDDDERQAVVAEVFFEVNALRRA